MNWQEISIQTNHEAVEAISNIFQEIGATGVIIEDPLLVNQYLDSGLWDYTDIEKSENTEVVIIKAYLPVDAYLEDRILKFQTQVEALESFGINKGLGIISYQDVAEEDWATSWKQYFHPVKIGQRIVIKPSWEDYQASSEEIIIELDPGMAFGTGTHHTTAMCLKALEKLVVPGTEVFDVGTGSGILAIAAAKLGAKSIRAVDLDAVATKVAKENIRLNNEHNNIEVAEGDLLSGFTGKADIVIANIIADVIKRLLEDISLRLKPNGILLASGIIKERAAEIITVAQGKGLIVEEVMEEGGWVAMIIRNGVE